ncbi:MAG: S-methyl-5-thioribose-1-phosphate isomerase [Thermoproteota archaeon]
MYEKRTITFKNGKIYTIDQSKLPKEEKIIVLENYKEVAEAIKSMKIRGAPIIGVACAFALAVEANKLKLSNVKMAIRKLEKVSNYLKNTRPTGKNLFWAIDKVLEASRNSKDVKTLKRNVIRTAEEIAENDVKANKKLVENGEKLIKDGDVVLTHCNSGRLATVAYGTALGSIIKAWKSGKRFKIFITETRPLLQGARLTAWELKKEKIPFHLITDNMVAFVMKKEKINKVFVGADRVWSDGSVANKIGTYGIAIISKVLGSKFFVVAPSSTFDLSLKPNETVVEFRKEDEVTSVMGLRIAPRGVKVLNPAFDITPPEYINAIVTEKGVINKPFSKNIKKFLLNYRNHSNL